MSSLLKKLLKNNKRSVIDQHKQLSAEWFDNLLKLCQFSARDERPEETEGVIRQEAVSRYNFILTVLRLDPDNTRDRVRKQVEAQLDSEKGQD